MGGRRGNRFFRVQPVFLAYKATSEMEVKSTGFGVGTQDSLVFEGTQFDLKGYSKKTMLPVSIGKQGKPSVKT